MPSSVTPIGLALGMLYVGSIVGIVWWITTVGPAQATRRSARSWNCRNCIIVSLSDSATSIQTVEFACQLASERHSQLMLAYVIVIPMTLGLDVLLQAAEDHANIILQEGENIANEFDVATERHIIRHRSSSHAILELAEETGAETIVVDAGASPWWSLARIGQNVSVLMRNAPCQVIVAKAPVAI